MERELWPSCALSFSSIPMSGEVGFPTDELPTSALPVKSFEMLLILTQTPSTQGGVKKEEVLWLGELSVCLLYLIDSHILYSVTNLAQVCLVT